MSSLRRRSQTSGPPLTPDKRYIVVRERLWRATNPALSPARREALTRQLMDARRAVARGQKLADAGLVKKARETIQRTKVALGERGPVWWKDGARDFNRHLVKNTPYASWYSSHVASTKSASGPLRKLRRRALQP